jgi:dephospho-CoA kinase
VGVGDYRGGVLRIAVTGGIGSGKTTVTDYLRERGATVVDADVIAREVVAVGEPALSQLRDAFGDAILAADGSLDRSFVAEVVFNDRSALARLNRITHAAIGVELVRQVAEASGEVVVVAIPLLRPEHRDLLGLNEVWTVEVEPDVAVERLTGPRGLSEADARARIAAQIDNGERRALADVVIDNSGSPSELRQRIDSLLAERVPARG